MRRLLISLLTTAALVSAAACAMTESGNAGANATGANAITR